MLRWKGDVFTEPGYELVEPKVVGVIESRHKTHGLIQRRLKRNIVRAEKGAQRAESGALVEEKTRFGI
jgi:hypothetical protein